MKRKAIVIFLALLIMTMLCSCIPKSEVQTILEPSNQSSGTEKPSTQVTTEPPTPTDSPKLELVDDGGEDTGTKAFSYINGNVPEFSDEDKQRTDPFKDYSDLDTLGRCGIAYANICKEYIPTEERGSIGMVKPSGWQTIRIDFVEGGYLYNRCHLVGYQLAGDNADERNLITGTRYLNTVGMLPFENKVSNYMHKNPDNHVLYRVTPIYAQPTDLIASGVKMEAYSVEDHGEGISFNVFCPNVQPGVEINYQTGDAIIDPDYIIDDGDDIEPTDPNATEYVVNSRSMKFHKPECSKVKDIAEYNRHTLWTTREDLIADGYSPCGFCNP